jgi:diacylglycerol kinase family enzyme
MLVKVSSVSPLGHAATAGAGVDGTVNAAIAGAAAMASANPPAMINRRTEIGA